MACPPPLWLISVRKPVVGPITSSYGYEQDRKLRAFRGTFQSALRCRCEAVQRASSVIGGDLYWSSSAYGGARLLSWLSHIYILPPLRPAQEEAYDVIWDVAMIHTHVSSLASPPFQYPRPCNCKNEKLCPAVCSHSSDNRNLYNRF